MEEYTAALVEAKLRKLAEFEAKEAMKEKWIPYRELEAKLHEMYRVKDTVDTAASYTDEASEKAQNLDMTPEFTSDLLWEYSSEIDELMEKTEKELNELYVELGGE